MLHIWEYSMQEQQQLIESLKAKYERVEAENNSMKAEFAEIKRLLTNGALSKK